MTSAAEGGGGFEMLTVADKGGGGGLSLADVSAKILKFWQKLFQIKRAYNYA